MQGSKVLQSIAALAAFASAMPQPVEPPTRALQPRQQASTYTCVMNAAASNAEYVGAPIISKRTALEEHMNKRASGGGASPADFPLAGGAVTPNTFMSSTGLTIGIAGATKSLYSSSDFNVWNLNSQTLSASDTGLPMDLEYWNDGGIPTFSCGMSYNGVSYTCDQSDDIEIVFLGSSSSQYGQVQFPCVMTPPPGGYAGGWCTTHVTQYQKPDPSTDPYTLDVSVYDAEGVPIGSETGAVSSTAVTGALPYTFDVGTGGVDDDPVTFAYGGDSWDSNDSTNHQCSVGSYDSGKRQMDCGFTC